MQYRPLGKTGIDISAIAFGAGPVSALMTGEDLDQQTAVLQRALELGVNWIDTAATYGMGRSEQSLGAALKRLDATDKVHLATKARVMPDQLDDIAGTIRTSVNASLQRLGVERVALLQLHNSITARRGDEPTSLAVADVLGEGGVLDCFKKLQAEGLVQHLGLTGIGQSEALCEVIDSGQFATIQTPYHLLNPSAGRKMPSSFEETDYGDLISNCARQQMGVLVIRVFAGGALLGNRPSSHTFKTQFFPLDLFERDRGRAAAVEERLDGRMSMPEAAVRFALSHPNVSAAILGFGDPAHVDQAATAADVGALPNDVLQQLNDIHKSEE